MLLHNKQNRTMNILVLTNLFNLTGAKIFGIPVEPDSTSCKTEDQTELNTYTTADFNHQVISKGSDPTNIEEWATQEFTPIPLKYRFSPIANLFQKVFIDDKGYTNSAGEVINSTAIRMWFVPLYYDYCVTMGLDCSVPKGCGIDDQCPFDTLCNGTADEPHECTGENTKRRGREFSRKLLIQYLGCNSCSRKNSNSLEA